MVSLNLASAAATFVDASPRCLAVHLQALIVSNENMIFLFDLLLLLLFRTLSAIGGLPISAGKRKSVSCTHDA
jgi:hypothetical protein